MKKCCLAFLALLLATAGALQADQITAAVQQALKEQGFYYGEVTGEKTADTTAAIRRYQIRNGLQVTGEIDAETLRSLGVGTGSARATPPPPPATQRPEKRRRRTTARARRNQRKYRRRLAMDRVPPMGRDRQDTNRGRG